MQLSVKSLHSMQSPVPTPLCLSVCLSLSVSLSHRHTYQLDKILTLVKPTSEYCTQFGIVESLSLFKASVTGHKENNFIPQLNRQDRKILNYKSVFQCKHCHIVQKFQGHLRVPTHIVRALHWAVHLKNKLEQILGPEKTMPGALSSL